MTAWPEQQVVEVADGVIAVIQGAGEAGVSNAGLVIDAGRALVVDTFMFPEMADGLAAELDKRSTTAEIVLNTHHHIDHIGGNSRFPEAKRVAHRRAVETIERTGHPTVVYDRFMPAFAGRFDAMELAPPSPYAEQPLPRAARVMPYAPAHTPGDLAVWLPDERVLFSGDLCFFDVVPLALQGLLSAWIAAVDDLIALEPAVVVPGHGPIGGVVEMRRARKYLAAVSDHARQAVEAGTSLEEAVASFDSPDGKAIESERNIVNIERGMQEAAGAIDAERLDILPSSFATLLR